MKHTIKSILLAGAAAIALASTALPALAQQKTLKFVSWQKDERGVGDWWAAIIKEFEAKNPGVKVEWTKVERGAYADTMTTLFAGGKPPEIVHLASFEFQKFADQGWLEDLAPYIRSSGLNLDGWAGQSACQWKGKPVCVMMLYFGNIFAYNEEMLKKGGGGQYLSELMNYTLDAGGRWTDANGKVTINTPQMVEGLARWKDVVKNSLTPRDLSAGETRQMFADGRIAMKLDGPWLYPIIQRGKAKDQIKIVPPPFNPPLGGSSNILGMASEIPADSKKLVWDFISIATSDKFQSDFATLANSTPPSPRAKTDGAKAATPHFDTLVQTAQAASKAGVDRIPKGLEIQYNEFAKMIMEEAQRMIIQDLDPKAVAATMQSKAEAIQKQ
jgi:multiple sugar transport system substrate-binding protein